MGEVTVALNEQELLDWFYPNEILHFWQREEDVHKLILDGMRIGDAPYTPMSSITYYQHTKPAKVPLEAMLDDLCGANLVLFGKNAEMVGQAEKEQEIVKQLVQRFADKSNGKEITIASTTGNFASMGGLEGMTFSDVLTDSRLRPELDEYLASQIDIISPAASGRVFFPDNKFVRSKKENLTLLQEFKNWRHVLPVERARAMKGSFTEFFNKYGSKEVIYCFGTNLFTLSSFTVNDLYDLRNPNSQEVRVVNQCSSRLSLAMPNVESGIYRIEFGDRKIVEYVIVTAPINAIQPKETASESKLILELLSNGREEHELTPEGRALYRKIRELEAKKERPAPEIPEESTVSGLILHHLKNQLPIVQSAGDWFSSIVNTSQLETVLSVMKGGAVPWEQTDYHAKNGALYTSACNALKDLEPLVKKYADQLGFKEAFDKSAAVKKEYEDMRETHAREFAIAQKMKNRGTQTIPIYLCMEGANFQVLMPFASNDDAVERTLDKEISDFLQKTADATIGATAPRSIDGLHALVAPQRDAPLVFDYARRIIADQKSQTWNKLGYHIDVIVGPSAPASVMQSDSVEPTAGISFESDYDTVRAHLQPYAPSIALPERDDIKKLGASKVHGKTISLFAAAVVALSDGKQYSAAELKSKIMALGVDKPGAHNFAYRGIEIFPSAFIVDKKDNQVTVCIKQEYLSSLQKKF